jgi:drug/metabolite transporter (DMT)-like permease
METTVTTPKIQPYVGPLIAAAACWGIGTVMTKGVLGSMPPLTLLVVQLMASLGFLWGIIVFKRPAFVLNREFGWLALAGWLNPGLAYTFGLLGLVLTTASSSALIWAAEPVLILALAWPILKERPNRAFIILSLLAVSGALLVVGGGSTTGSQLSGNLLILTAVFCCAVYTVLSRKLVTNIDPLLLAAIQQSVSLIWAVAIWLIAGRTEAIAPIPITTWLWAALSGVVYYGLAFWFYIIGLKQTTASQAGFFLNLIPIFGLAGAYLFLNERLTIPQGIGALLILIAVFTLSRVSATRRSSTVKLDNS